MSRLDSAIRRLLAQRACLEAAAAGVMDIAGPVLELGLGNGRTYDHLRTILPDRVIYVFDRQIAAHPDCLPPAPNIFVGEFAVTLSRAAQRLGATVALIHADIGSGDKDETARTVASIAPLIPPLLRPGGLLVADQAIDEDTLERQPTPGDVPPDRYFIYRRAGP